MNKMKKIIFTLLATSTFTLAGGMAFAFADSAANVTFDEASIQSVYVENQTFTLPSIKAYADGQEYQTNATIVLPDGRICYAESFPLNQLGEYSVIYTTTIGGKNYEKEYAFTVNSNSTGLFTVNNGTVKIGQSDYSQYLYGAQFDMNVGGTVEYNKIINLSESTKNDCLIEFVVTAHEMNVADFTQIEFTLTDIYDEDNFVKIRVYDAGENSYYRSYVQAKGPEQAYGGIEGTKPNFGVDHGGTVVTHSFRSLYNMESSYNHRDASDAPVLLYYDNEERAVYVRHWATREKSSKLVLDLDNEEYITSPFPGFTTGEVKLTISMAGVLGTPRFVVKSVDGNTIENEDFVDEKAPVINDEIPDTVPSAIIGKPYKLFGANAYDNNALYSYEKKVYYKYGSGNEIDVAIIDDTFTPHREGVYTLVYTATDIAGNKTEVSTEITAYEASEITELSVRRIDENEIAVQAGEKIDVSNYATEGGVGGETVSVYLKKGSEEKKIESRTLVLYESGNYELVYTVIDYVGNQASKSYAVSVTENDRPLMFEEIQMPETFISGINYALPQTQAYDYSSGSEQMIAPTITATLNGETLAIKDGEIKPIAKTDGDMLHVVYTYTNSKGNTVSFPFDVPVIFVKEGTSIKVEKYFVCEGFETEALSDSIAFKATAEEGLLTFVRPVQAKSLALNFAFDETAFKAEYADITLLDKYNADEIVTLRVYKEGRIAINGGESKLISITKASGIVSFMLNYDNEDFSFRDGLNNLLGKANTNIYGETFEGFTSEEVFVSVKATGMTVGDTFYCREFNGQSLTNSTRDSSQPQLFINSMLGGKHELGATVTIPAAQGYDVLSNIGSFTVSVENQNTGTLVLEESPATKDYQITLETYGNYLVTYTLKDGANKKTEMTRVLNVLDDVPPTISVSDIPTSAKVGQSFEIPSPTLSDNISPSDEIGVYIAIVAPNGTQTFVFVGNKYKWEQKGTYSIRIRAMDQAGNTTLLEYKVNVS